MITLFKRRRIFDVMYDWLLKPIYAQSLEACIREYPCTEIFQSHPEYTGRRALPLLAENGYTSLVVALTDRMGHREAPIGIAASYAASSGYIDLLMLLVEEYGADVSDNGSHAMSSAARNGHLEVVEYLHEECGMSVDVRDGFPIQCSIVGKHVDVMKYIMRSSNFSAPYYCYIYQAAMDTESIEVVQELIEWAGVRSSCIRHLFIQSVQQGNLDILRYLTHRYHGVVPFRRMLILESSLTGYNDVTAFLLDHNDEE